MIHRRRLIEVQAEAEVGLFNSRHPVGSDVLFWPGAKDGPGRKTVTRSLAFVASGRTPAVLVGGYSGWIALSHVQPAPPAAEEVVPGGWFPNYDGQRDGGTER